MPGRQEQSSNQVWTEMIERDPLIAFSWYLAGRKNALLGIGNEVLTNLDEAFSDSGVDGCRLERAESLLWLWTLGAYEIVRTMDQAKRCFSARVQAQLRALKTELAEARMPAAKMEKRGVRSPVSSDRSPAGLDPSGRDLLIGDPTRPTMVSARRLLARFAEVMSAIGASDVVARHEESYLA